MTLSLIKMDRPRSYPPRQTEFTRHFWGVLNEGRFETTRCDDCGRPSFPPKPFCPHCWSRNVAWIELSGRGKLYAQTVVHAAPSVFRDEAPYRVGIVDLEEGVRIASSRDCGSQLYRWPPVRGASRWGPPQAIAHSRWRERKASGAETANGPVVPAHWYLDRRDQQLGDLLRSQTLGKRPEGRGRVASRLDIGVLRNLCCSSTQYELLLEARERMRHT